VNAWFDQHESFLVLGDHAMLTAGELRSLIGPRPPAILVLNSHYTAFLPRHVRPASDLAPGAESQSPPTWHIGFAPTAVAAGVGAFVGCFESPSDEAGKTFGVELHRALAAGATIVDAVRQARVETLAQDPDDMTALQYVLAGHPG
jgi:hypothetical protein